MTLVLKMAWRNVWRNTRRTVLTLSAVSVGLAAMVLFLGLMDGMMAQTFENSIRGNTGHIKIYPKGYQDSPSVSKRIKEPGAVLEAVLSEPYARQALLRINAQGLIATEAKSVGVSVVGMDIAKEEGVTDFKRYVREGSYYLRKNGILVGKDLAERMKVKLNDEVSIIVQAADGSIGADNYVIEGLMETGEFGMDNTLVVMSLEDVDRLAVLSGGVSEIMVFLESSENTDEAVSRLEKTLHERDVEFATWKELLTFLIDLQGLVQAYKYIPLAIVVVVVSIGILNTVLMSVMERTKEFGIMAAIGTSPARTVALIFVETFMISVTGILLGVMAGAGALIYFEGAGVDLAMWGEGLRTIPFHPTVIYPVVEPGSFLSATEVVFFSSMFSAVYPAYRAARFKPAEALRAA